MSFELPNQAALDSSGGFTPIWLQWLTRIQAVCNASQESGETANRPTVGLWVGRCYYDETLNKPVYVRSVRPTVWKDSQGTTV